MAANTFFDSLNSITTNKKYWMETPYEERQYAPIGVNIGLSQHLDAIFYVNEINQYWNVISNKMHYDYMFYSIRQMRRKFGKWAKKKENDTTVALIQEYYQCNKQRAKEYFEILSKDQLKKIEAALEKGTK